MAFIFVFKNFFFRIITAVKSFIDLHNTKEDTKQDSAEDN